MSAAHLSWPLNCVRTQISAFMRDFFGTLTFIAGTGTFRIIYGQWPPTSGRFGQWLLSDGKARWAILAGMLVGMVATSIVRGLTGTLRPADPRLEEALQCLQLGMTYHQDRRIEEATHMFQRAIALYTECGRAADAAPAYASLGKLYFDTGALDLAEQQLMEARPRFAQQMEVSTSSMPWKFISTTCKDFRDGQRTYMT
jgi:tetratricopeptide (TPR) repeat protein